MKSGSIRRRIYSCRPAHSVLLCVKAQKSPDKQLSAKLARLSSPQARRLEWSNASCKTCRNGHFPDLHQKRWICEIRPWVRGLPKDWPDAEKITMVGDKHGRQVRRRPPVRCSAARGKNPLPAPYRARVRSGHSKLIYSICPRRAPGGAVHSCRDPDRRRMAWRASLRAVSSSPA